MFSLYAPTPRLGMPSCQITHPNASSRTKFVTKFFAQKPSNQFHYLCGTPQQPLVFFFPPCSTHSCVIKQRHVIHSKNLAYPSCAGSFSPTSSPNPMCSESSQCVAQLEIEKISWKRRKSYVKDMFQNSKLTKQEQGSEF